MNTADFFSKLDALLDIHGYDTVDSALNGVQVGCDRNSIERVITAVDASMETIERALSANADCLVVHHGIFWGGAKAITGNHRARIRALVTHDCALYAAHLPLDAHPTLGNNIAIAEQLRLTDIEPFGNYHGVDIGYCGTLTTPQTIQQIEQTLLQADSARPLGVLPFGAAACARVGIVSGGGNRALDEAIARRLDLLITGDASHTNYYDAQENNINVLFAGHYNSETWGVRRIAAHLQQEFKVTAEFIDLPTGL